MKKIKITAIVVLVLIACLGCVNTNGGVKDKENEEYQDIVFIYQQVTYSDMFSNCGYFIDGEGNKFSYDMSDEEKKYVDITELYKELLLRKDKLQSEEYLSQTEWNECYALLQEIKGDGEYSEENYSFDRGDICWYGVRQKADGGEELILLERTGDVLRKSKDEKVETLVRFLNEEAME